jgi:hypothetical protein
MTLPHKRRVSRAYRIVIPFVMTIGLTLLPSTPAWAQQSLFNVPSAKLTTRGDFFFQEQVALAKTGESNLVTEIGLGKNLELGLDINHVRLYPRELAPLAGDPAGDAFVSNAQWIVPATPWLNFAVGTQQGISAHDARPGVRYVGMGWTGLRFEPAQGRYGGYVIGGYYGSLGFTGSGIHGGGLLGFELPILGEHLSLCADWMVGTNRLSVAVIGIQAMPVPAWGWQISLGAQLPALAPDSGYAVVLELTRLHGLHQEEHETSTKQRNQRHRNES